MPIKPLHVAILVLVTVIWGGNFAIAKIAMVQLPPLFLVSLRWALVALMLVPFVPMPRGHWRSIVLISVTLGFLHFALMFWGLRELDAGTAAIAIQLQVPFAALLAAVFFKDRLGWRRTLGMAIAFAGVSIVAGEPKLEGHYLALAMVISAACIWSVGNIQIKLLGEIDGMVLNGWLGVFAAPQLALASWLLEDGQFAALAAADWTLYAALVYQAVMVVGVGYAIWFRMLRRYDVNQVMPLILLVPGFGVLSGILMLGETLTPIFVAGSLLAIFGVGIIILRRPKLVAPETERI